MSAILQPLIETGRLWRGQGTAPQRDALPTGIDALDRVLPGGGWPRAALSEILFPADGVGELRLLLPALAMLSREARPIVLIAPPYLPFPAAWTAAVGGRTMPALGRVRGGAVLAAAGGYRDAAASAACGGNRADDRFHAAPRAGRDTSFDGGGTHRHRNRSAAPAHSEMPGRESVGAGGRFCDTCRLMERRHAMGMHFLPPARTR
jgi:hypothetical protein